MWRVGKVLRPYYEDVKLIVQNKANYHQLANSPVKVVELCDLSFEHCPIVDCGITDDDRVLDLCHKLVADIARGEVIYLHCWGGHGRTGTVVSIMLHLMYGVRHSTRKFSS
jgi:protein-tyrosine phosphatase